MKLNRETITTLRLFSRLIQIRLTHKWQSIQLAISSECVCQCIPHSSRWRRLWFTFYVDTPFYVGSMEKLLHTQSVSQLWQWERILMFIRCVNGMAYCCQFKFGVEDNERKKKKTKTNTTKRWKWRITTPESTVILLPSFLESVCDWCTAVHKMRRKKNLPHKRAWNFVVKASR